MIAASLTQSKELWYVMRATGLVSLGLLTLTMVAGVVNVRRHATPRWPRAIIVLLHRNVALLAVVFLGVHVGTAIIDTDVSVGWMAALVPMTSHWDRFWVGLGTVSVDVMIALVVTSLLRARMKHRTWRAVHWLAYASWPLAMAHGFGSGTDSGTWWARSVYVISLLAVVAAVGWRLRRPAGQVALLRRPAAQRVRMGRPTGRGALLGPTAARGAFPARPAARSALTGRPAGQRAVSDTVRPEPAPARVHITSGGPS